MGIPSTLLQGSLVGARIAVDVQHLYRPDRPDDQGAVFTLADGTSVTEAHCATLYAQALRSFLEARGAMVLANAPARGILVGHYSSRQREATGWGAHAYLACHVNAGGGSYARAEYMAGSDPRMAQAIVGELTHAFPELTSGIIYPLSRGVRGAVCVEGFTVGPTALLEPFFGDNPNHQRLIAAGGLVALGEAIGRGVSAWWQSRPAPMPIRMPA